MAATVKPLFWQICLENTRLLVKGIECLHLDYQRKQRENSPGRNLPWQLSELKRFVLAEYRDSIQDGVYLAQNPYTELFQFRFPTPDISGMEEDSPRLGGMILLYHQLQILEDLPSDLLAEAYETLCNGICSILEADMCYIVSRHLTDTRLLCASSITDTENDLDAQLTYKDLMEKDLYAQPTSKELGELLDQLKEDSKFLQPVEDIFLKQDDTGSGNPASSDDGKKKIPDTLILPIMLYDKNGRPRDEQIYLICQRRNKPCWCRDIDQTILRIRDTLFLRGKLAQALARDLTDLLTVAREFRSIRRKSPESGPLKILHISDLHVTEWNCEQFINDIQKLKLNDAPFDFLVITGDVVQGRYAAGDLEKNYNYAAMVIQALAMRMWGEYQDGKRVLCQDWKRRTIVIPGNHDYASMNELETQHGENHRASESGRPAAQEGSAMAKFTYYINFVRKLLDIEIGELIDNSLNELRCYDKMGIAFLCFNTSVMANPARNNKVHLDESFAHRAIRQLSAEKARQVVVFLGHHGPDYSIDYVSDEYLEPFICHEITQGFTEALGKDSPEEQKKALDALKQSMDQLTIPSGGDEIDNDFIQAWLLKNEPKEMPSDVKDKVITRRKKTRLYNQLTFLLSQLEKSEAERSINERYQKIIAEVNRAKLLSQKDRNYYRQVFQLLLNSLKPAVCLSGHTHVWEKNKNKEDANHHYVVKRFGWVKTVRTSSESRGLQQVRFLNYGVCEIATARLCPNVKISYQRKEEPISR